jgi:hypothetical protein
MSRTIEANFLRSPVEEAKEKPPRGKIVLRVKDQTS